MPILLVFLALSAPKRPSASPEQQAYDRAKNAYDEVQYGEAIGVLDGLLGRSDLSPPLRDKATLLIGFCQVGLGNLEAAEKRFRELLARDLDLKLPGGTSPKIKEQFERVRSLVLREKVREAEQKPKVADQPKVIVNTPPPAASEPVVTKPIVVIAETPVHKKAWFWVVIVGGAAVIAAGVTTAVVLADRAQQRPGGIEVDIGTR